MSSLLLLMAQNMFHTSMLKVIDKFLKRWMFTRCLHSDKIMLILFIIERCILQQYQHPAYNINIVVFRDSTLTRLLRESLGSTTCRATMIGHISPSIPFYTESLSCVQFAARIHRLRRKKGGKVWIKNG